MYERHRHTLARTRSSEHYAWTNMIQRCTNQNRADYGFYGGRGIQVHPAWRGSFAAFLADMGLRPSKQHSLDRWPDQNGNYAPGNCRWATKDQQMQNTRATRIISFQGKAMGLNAWARELGMTHGAIQGRLNRGWPIEKALTQQKRKEVRHGN